MNNQNYMKRKTDIYLVIDEVIGTYYKQKFEYDKIKFKDSKYGGLFYKFKRVKDKEFLKNIISKMTIEFRKESAMLSKGSVELAKMIATETFADNRNAYMLVGKTEFSIDYKVKLFDIYYDLVYIFGLISNLILNNEQNPPPVNYFDDKTIVSDYIDKLIPTDMNSSDNNINDFEKFNKLSVAYLLKCFEQKKFDLKPYLFFEDYQKLQKDRLLKYGIGKFKKSNEGQGKKGQQGKKRQGQQGRQGKKGKGQQGKKRQGQQGRHYGGVPTNDKKNKKKEKI